MNISGFATQHPYELKVIYSLLAVAAAVLANRWISYALHGRIHDAQKFYRVKTRIKYGTTGGLAIILFATWVGDIQSFSTYLGLLSAGIAIALRDLIVNIAAWGFIVTRRPFEVGDRIEIGNISGDVIDKRIFQFTLMEIGNWVHGDQSTGRVIHIPNQQVFALPLANYTKGFTYIWNEINVLITFESNWEKAKHRLLAIAELHSAHLTAHAEDRVRAAARKFMIHYNNLTPIVYTSVEADGILLSIRYLCDPKKRRSSQELIWEDILRLVDEQPDIHLAYKTIRTVT